MFDLDSKDIKDIKIETITNDTKDKQGNIMHKQFLYYEITMISNSSIEITFKTDNIKIKRDGVEHSFPDQTFKNLG